jgi:3-methyladenine DNA glycosylase AlkC
MAEPLKNHFGPQIPRRIAGMIAAAYPGFDSRGFVCRCLRGYDALELMPRGRHIARGMHEFLPGDYEAAVSVLLKSLGPRLENTAANGMAPFLYLPYVFYVAEHGLGHFEASMRAQYELTQRFTAEFSIRPYLERYPRETLQRLMLWTNDPSEHVRRLVSEGTRPRLPWAPRLRQFQRDPAPVLRLLERLKDDPSLYVRRSVANNLNDIGKDHPELLVETARRWLEDGSADRQWLVRHALRSAIKRSDAKALAVLGFGSKPRAAVSNVQLTPRRPRIGDRLRLSADIRNTGKGRQNVLVDFCVYFVKASGRPSRKVFKLASLALAPGASMTVCKTISLAQQTTRKHYPGRHKLDLILNGHAQPLAVFDLQPDAAGPGARLRAGAG